MEALLTWKRRLGIYFRNSSVGIEVVQRRRNGQSNSTRRGQVICSVATEESYGANSPMWLFMLNLIYSSKRQALRYLEPRVVTEQRSIFGRITSLHSTQRWRSSLYVVNGNKKLWSISDSSRRHVRTSTIKLHNPTALGSSTHVSFSKINFSSIGC